jgi:hypothetical protein
VLNERVKVWRGPIAFHTVERCGAPGVQPVDPAIRTSLTPWFFNSVNTAAVTTSALASGSAVAESSGAVSAVVGGFGVGDGVEALVDERSGG